MRLIRHAAEQCAELGAFYVHYLVKQNIILAAWQKGIRPHWMAAKSSSTKFFHLKSKEAFMIARLTSFGINPKDVDDLKRIYNEEVIPVLKKQKGFIGAWLLEPTNVKDQFISLTEWVAEADANAYESSGTYKQLVGKVKDRFTGEPVLKVYTAAETKLMATV